MNCFRAFLLANSIYKRLSVMGSAVRGSKREEEEGKILKVFFESDVKRFFFSKISRIL